ncbi:MAG: alanine racemase [Clostridiales bacterium]|nr:alanine racemase [Clostridiales bacterium]
MAITADMFSRCCVEIDLDALKNNIREIRRVTSPSADVMAVVKADAYGHGAVICAKTLLENGADHLCVATIDEAIELRDAGITSKILILGFTSTRRFSDVVKYDIDQAIYSLESAKILSEEAVRQGKNVNVHIKLDTGMGRIGFSTEPDSGSVEDIVAISKLPNIVTYGVFSHFAVADENDDEYTYAQFKRFNDQIEQLRELGVTFTKRHISNSAGIMRFPEMHLDMVRAGIILYGLMPPGCPPPAREINLVPVMSWYAKIIHEKVVPEGASVSYGRHFKADKPTRVLTVSIGYADGLSRRVGNGSFELEVNGTRLPIIGNVCMDMCMLDASSVPSEEKIPSECNVLIFGKNKKADELASYLGTINYEITCVVGKRVQRIYLENGEHFSA